MKYANGYLCFESSNVLFSCAVMSLARLAATNRCYRQLTVCRHRVIVLKHNYVSSSSADKSAGGAHGDALEKHGHHDEHVRVYALLLMCVQDEHANLPRHADDYVPGASSYAYDNPWPKLNKGRLDWFFGDGWRRPLAKDQGLYTRKEWVCWGFNEYDEYEDWKRFHQWIFVFCTLTLGILTVMIVFFIPDWPSGHDWSKREAYLEIERRERAGLPLISKDLIDPVKVAAQLPSENDLKDFQIII